MGTLLKNELVAAAGRAAHSGRVVGLAVDHSNRIMVSGGYDGVVRVWDYKKRIVTDTIKVRELSRRRFLSSPR
jgi:WD40 repeat protein